MSIIRLNSRRFTPPADEEFWTPAEWGTSIVWYDAADLSTITTVSGAVTNWQDKSGNGRNLTALAARPTYTANGLNNRPALSWPLVGGQAGMTWTGAAFNPVRTFGVARYEGLIPFGQTSALLSFNYSGLNDLFLAGTTDRWLFDRLVFLNGNESSSNVALPAVASPFLWADDTTPTAGRTALWIGNHGGGQSPPWRGKIGQVIITLFLPTLRERRIVTGYMAWEYGLETLLPADHPFRNRRPLLSD